jgi:hypothetical protein
LKWLLVKRNVKLEIPPICIIFSEIILDSLKS